MIVRPVTVSDAKLLYEWRNDPLTIAMSKKAEPLEWSAHIDWLTRRLSQPEPHLYVAEIDGIPVGTIRLDDGQVSYTTAPAMRGMGVATRMLQWSHSTFGPLTAEIKPENGPSLAAARRAGHRVVILAPHRL